MATWSGYGGYCNGFQETPCILSRRHFLVVPYQSPTCRLAKGFQGVKNKQAALAQKMELAKKQKRGISYDIDHADGAEEQVDPEGDNTTTKEDHAEFARLLSENPPKVSMMKDSGSKADDSEAVVFKPRPKKPKIINAPKNKKSSNPPSITKSTSASTAEEGGKESACVLLVGDMAKRCDFEALVNPTTGQPMGPLLAAQLVPWVPPYCKDYLVVVVDPRRGSNDLRLTIQYLQSTSAFLKNCNEKKTTFLAIFANDTPKEILAWKERVHVPDEFYLACDSSSLEWMTTYACVDTWSLQILILDNDGIIRFHQQGVDPSKACQLVDNTIMNMS
jgi:hypothetical protein